MSDPINPMAPSQPIPSDHGLWPIFYQWAVKRVPQQVHANYWECFLLGVKAGSEAAIDSMKVLNAAIQRHQAEQQKQSHGASSDSDFDAD